MPRQTKKSPDVTPDAAPAAAIDIAMNVPEVNTKPPAPVKKEEPGIVDLLERASDEQKAAIRKALGVAEVVTAPKPKTTNADARQLLAANGGGTIQPPGFQPVPPEGVAAKGPQAVARWLQRWHDGQTWGSRHAEISGDAEALAATAVE